MHPSQHAITTPDKIACTMSGSGQSLTYAELESRSNQIAHLLRSRGLKPGGVIAVMMENNLRFFELAWAAQKSGLYFVCISSRLTPKETLYILRDSDAQVFVTSHAMRDVATPLTSELSGLQLFMSDGAVAPFEDLEAAYRSMPSEPVHDQVSGGDILYSSGTTGTPKGIKLPLTGAPIETPDTMERLASAMYAMNESTVYLSPAPLYHAAPLRWTMGVQRLGGTVVVMEKFDPEDALRLIERHQVTHAQFVPTHFVRLLRLPDDVKQRHGRPALTTAIHAAAPCPVPVKEAMIAWWGPVIVEYYGGSEGNGVTMIRSEEWLAHKGSVGRPIFGKLHICDENGDEVPNGTTGGVYFSDGAPINYHNAPEKTAEAYNKHGWSTIGDIGWVDDEGYLYLTDRASFTIISGGVNVYPQEIENLLITHPGVADVAVFGAPDQDLGEKVVAVVQPVAPITDAQAFRSELLAFARNSLSGVKIPRQIDFREELPRHPTGKLYKRLLKDEYAAAAAS